jgi:hypothetical protein
MSPSSEGHVRDDARRAGTGRRILGLAIAVVLGLLWLQPAMASADPVDPQNVPQNLRLFVPDSAEWQTSPWMTSANCVDHGGDWSLYSSYLIKDMVDLLEFFQPNFGGSPDEANTPKRKPLIVKGYQDIAATLSAPGGYCVDLVKKWATPNPSYKPFGFEWGNANNWGDHAVRPFSQCSGTDSLDKVAPCRGFYISCDGATSQQEHTSCEAWNAFSDDYVKRMNTVLTNAYTQYGIVVDGRNQTKTVIKSPGEVAQEFLNWVAKKGMEQVVSFIVSGVTKLWATFLRIAVDYSSPNVTGMAFASVYNLIAGIALALAFLGWLVTLATSWRRGHLQFSLFGAVKAVAGVTLAGVGAILMLALADDCTRSLASAGGNLASQADFTGSLLKVNPLVALLAGVLIALFLIFAVIFLVLNSALVLMWALFGSIAAAGQVHPASSGWLLKWAGRLTALAWAKFVMVGVMLLAQALLLPLDAGEDPTKQVVDVVQGVALCFLLITCPYLLLELVDFVSDRVGGAMASGGPAGARAGKTTGAAARTGGSAVTSAVSTMMAAAAEVGRRFTGGSTGGSAGGGQSGVPRPDGHAGQHSTSDNKQSAAGGGGAGGHGRDSAGPDGEGVRPVPPSTAGGAGAETLPRESSGAVPPPPPANRGRVVASSSMRTPGAGGGGAGNGSPSARPGSGGARPDPPTMPPPA